LEKIDGALVFIQQQQQATAADIMFLGMWRDIAACEIGNKEMQTSITRFFKSSEFNTVQYKLFNLKKNVVPKEHF
jgi:hypothetical protein